MTSPVTGELLGMIRQVCTPCAPVFEVQDAQGNCIFKIEGPICQISCCSDINFPITTNDGSEVGKITKQLTGFIKESYNQWRKIHEINQIKSLLKNEVKRHFLV